MKLSGVFFFGSFWSSRPKELPLQALTKQSHNAHGSPESVTIKYPYHPLCSQEVKILGQIKQNEETCLIIELPTGRQHIPAWMTEDAAKCSPIVSSPTLNTKTLIHLCVFLKPVILSLSGAQCTPNKGVNNDNRKEPSN